jgi:hypothetical protein
VWMHTWSRGGGCSLLGWCAIAREDWCSWMLEGGQGQEDEDEGKSRGEGGVGGGGGGRRAGRMACWRGVGKIGPRALGWGGEGDPSAT